MKQTEILAPGPLLDSEGQLRRPGYSKTYVQTYDRKVIRVSPLRIKEWDYYLVSNGRFALALTVADNGYMGLDSVSLLALDEGCLTGGGREMPLLEVEVEVKSGSEEAATTFARQLAEEYGLTVERKSKYRRALGLARGE